nr:MAG TPA: hypothetical protein [Caudoviricetes sp.]
MGKIGDYRTVRIEDLRPYEKNARIHTSAQIELSDREKALVKAL